MRGHPSEGYDVDLRFLSGPQKEIARVSDAGGEEDQRRAKKWHSAAVAAGKAQKRAVDEPYTSRGNLLKGAQGDRFGKAGSTNYPERGKSFSGKHPQPFGYSPWGDPFS